MIMPDVDYVGEKERVRRRRLRLEQVRQQSKDIAHNIRARVHNETKKQLSKLEKQQGDELKRWKAKKMLMLHEQYSECLHNIGSSHEQASLQPSAEDVIASRKKRDSKIAEERALKATNNLRKQQKKFKNHEKTLRSQKKNTRDIENMRALFISRLGESDKCEFLKKGLSNINYNPERDLSNLTNKIDNSYSYNQKTNIDNNLIIPNKLKNTVWQNNKFNKSQTAKQSSKQYILQKNKKETDIDIQSNNLKDELQLEMNTKCMQTDFENQDYENIIDHNVESKCTGNIELSSKDRKDIKLEHDFNSKSDEDSIKENKVEHLNVLKDFRISDLISKRKQTHIDSSKITAHIKQSSPRFIKKMSSKNSDSRISNLINKRGDISPNKRNTFSRILSKSPSTKTSAPHVEFYDYDNHFSRHYTARSNLVEKTDLNDICIDSSDNDGENTVKNIDDVQKQQLKKRAKIACYKDRIDRDYKILLGDLNNLQREENFLNLQNIQSEYNHLSDRRLKQKTQRKQTKMELSLKHTTSNSIPTITIIPNDEKYKKNNTLFDIENGIVSELNVASWNLPQSTQKNDNKEQTLQNLFRRITLQKQLLLDELNILPEQKKLQKILKNSKRLKMNHPTNDDNLQSNDKSRLFDETDQNKIITTALVHNENIETPIENQCTDFKNVNERENHHKTNLMLEKSINKNDLISQCSDKNHKQCSSNSNKQKLVEIQIVLNKGSNDEHNIAINQKVADSIQITNIKKTKFSKSSKKLNKNLKENIKTLPDSMLENKYSINIKRPSDIDQSIAFLEPRELNTVIMENSESTSYFSPPEKLTCKSIDTKDTEKNNILISKHKNVEKCENTTFDENMKKLVDKLLMMSNNSINNLDLISVSDVSTPDSHVIQTSKNISNDTVDYAIKVSENNSNNTIEYIDCSSNIISMNDNSSSNFSVSNELVETSNAFHKQKKYSQANMSETDVNFHLHHTKKLPIVNQKETISNHTKDECSEVIFKYAELTENCAKRINNLTLLINQLRNDTKTVCPQNCSCLRQNSTLYMDLPISQCSSSSNDSEKTLLSEKNTKHMKDNNCIENLTNSNFKHSQPKITNAVSTSMPLKPDNDNNFIPVLKDIPKSSSEVINIGQQSSERLTSFFLPKTNDTLLQTLSFDTKNNHNINFCQYSINNNMNSFRPKPPLSLIQNAARHNIDIQMIPPHDLSTIVEVDTPIISRTNVSHVTDSSHAENMSKVQSMHKNFSFKQAKEESKNSVLNTSLQNILPSDVNNKNKVENVLCNNINSNTDKETIETLDNLYHISPGETSLNSPSSDDFETALRKMGIDWGISTIRKTQAAMQLSSSSSSLDVSLKRLGVKLPDDKPVNKSNESNVSLKEVLQRQLFKKLSESSSTSIEHLDKNYIKDNSIYENILPDISSINSTKNYQNKDKSQGRTSTPVYIVSKSPQSSNEKLHDIMALFSDIDLSSVKTPNMDSLSLTAPNISLNTKDMLNKCSNKI